MTETMESTPDWELVADGQQFPEGPAWNGKDALFFSNCNGGNISRIAHAEPGEDTASKAKIPGAEIFVEAREEPFTIGASNGLTFGADGRLYACDHGRGAVLAISMDGVTEIVAEEFEGEKLVRPNDLIFDKNGNLYFSDPVKYSRDPALGAVYRVDAKTGELSKPGPGIAFANGLAFSPDGKALMVAESAHSRVLKFPVNDDGSLGERSVFAEMPGGDPDGMNFDAEGNLYVAHFGGGKIWVFHPDGSVKEQLKAPGKKPSNVEFAGADLKTLYITEDETNAVYRIRVEIPGLPLYHQTAK